MHVVRVVQHVAVAGASVKEGCVKLFFARI